MSNTDDTHSRRAPSPLIAVILSGIFPGLGQLYNGQRRKALLFLAGAVLTAFGPVNPLEVEIDPAALDVGLEKVLLASLPFLLVALWSVIDAFRSAGRIATGSRSASETGRG